MPTRSSKLDLNQLAKRILDEAMGEYDKPADTPKTVAVRASGKKGGTARAAVLTPEQRSEIASVAANARWKKA